MPVHGRQASTSWSTVGEAAGDQVHGVRRRRTMSTEEVVLRPTSKTYTRKAVVLALGVLVAGATLAPATGSASAAPVSKSHRLKLTARIKQVSNKLSGPMTGTEGKGSASGTSAPPRVTYRWRFARGVINATSVGGRLEGTKVSSTFTIAGGTRKYRHSTGQGNVTGDMATGVFRFVGTISY
jgi:hypothetical protein